MASGSAMRRKAATNEAASNVDRKLVVAVLIALAVGLAAPRLMQQRPDRPVLRWIAGAAKNLLWIAVLAERPPETHDHRIVQSRHDEAGNALLDHGRGW